MKAASKTSCGPERARPRARYPKRLQIACLTEQFDYELQVGFPEKLPYPTQFMLDPIVKESLSGWPVLPPPLGQSAAAEKSGGVSD
nr:RecF protein [Raoultella sp. NCTC 9187]